jgi:hypothetical protein
MRATSPNTFERSAAGRWLRTPYRHKQISTLPSGSGIGSRISPTSNRRVTPARLARSCDRTRARRTCVSARSTPRAVIRVKPIFPAQSTMPAACSMCFPEFSRFPDRRRHIGCRTHKVCRRRHPRRRGSVTGAVVVQTDIGILNSGNMTNKGSHGTVLSQKVIRSRASLGWEEVREAVAPTREPNRRVRSAVNLVA